MWKAVSRTGRLVLLVVLCGSWELNPAEAGIAIIVTQTTIMPVEDPLSLYDFKLSLAAGNQILQNDNITLLNVANFDGNARYVFSSGGFDYSRFFSILTSPGTIAGRTNIELILTAAPPASLTNPDPINSLSIGDLYVETNVDFPPPSNSPLFDPINYTSQTHLFPSGALNTGSAITPTPSIVPEPSSLALVGISGLAGGLGILMTRKRRRLADLG